MNEQPSIEQFAANKEYFQYLLEVKKAALEESRERREDHWSRKYSSIIISAMVPISLAVIGAFASQIQSIQEKQQRHIENARTAIDLYFKNSNLFDTKEPSAAIRIKMLGVISDNDDVRRLLDEFFNTKVAAGASATPAESLQGFPDRLVGKDGGEYQISSFLIYPQGPDPKAAIAAKVQAALLESGAKVAPLDSRPKSFPDRNEIRYYRNNHEPVAQRMAALLKSRTGADFALVPLAMSNLPDGVMEIWLSKSQ
jgi:hypothetical protein